MLTKPHPEGPVRHIRRPAQQYPGPGAAGGDDRGGVHQWHERQQHHDARQRAGAENPDVKKAARSGGGKENRWARKALRSSPRMLWGA